MLLAKTLRRTHSNGSHPIDAVDKWRCLGLLDTGVANCAAVILHRRRQVASLIGSAALGTAEG